MQPQVLNPEFPDISGLGNAVFWSLSLFFEGDADNEYYNDGTGYITGELNQDIGPIQAGQLVNMTYRGDRVNVEIWIEESKIFRSVYDFRVILQKP